MWLGEPPLSFEISFYSVFFQVIFALTIKMYLEVIVIK